MKYLFFLLLVGSLSAQKPEAKLSDPHEGLWQGYDGELRHVSRYLLALAERIPAEKYSWRPAPGVRSTSEVMMHLAISNHGLLSPTGVAMPEDLTSDAIEKSVTTKPEVIRWLRRSLDAVLQARAKLKPADLTRPVKVGKQDATVDGMYLRILVHANEHLGQLIAYGRINGIAPPW
jgi:uncharacterized damage-inducible protein DinB